MANFTYDVFDRRIGAKYTSNGVTTTRWTAYDGSSPLLDFNGSGALVTRYLNGPAVDEVLARQSASGWVSWYLPDRQGTVRDLAGSGGASEDHVSYTAYGSTLSETNTNVGDRFKFQGMEQDVLATDTQAQLYHDGARYYDPASGRFIGQDPIGFAGGDADLYRFVGNGPDNAADPLGTFGDPTGGIGSMGPIDIVGLVTSFWDAWTGHSSNLGQEIGAGIGAGSPTTQSLNAQVYQARREQIPVALADPETALDAAAGFNSARMRINAQEVTEAGKDACLVGRGLLAAGQLGAEAYTVIQVGGALRVIVAPAATTVIEPIPLSGLAAARQLGLEGEQAVGVAGPKVGIRIPGTNQIRFPDGLDLTTKTLTEVKNRGCLSFTKQLRDYLAYAQQNGFTFELWVRKSTGLSGPLQDAINRGDIILRIIKGSQ